MNIVFLCPSPKNPVGGVKVIYQFCEFLNDNGISSQILHTDDVNGSNDWLNFNVTIRPSPIINPQSDFLIIPESDVDLHCDIVRSMGVRYAIFVQNPFYMIHRRGREKISKISAAYYEAEFILSISDFASTFISKVFSNVVIDKIIRVFPKLDTNIFFDRFEHSKTICMMPRKLEQHAYILTAVVNNTYPNWKVVHIDRLSETEVARCLQESSIFVSLSNDEGLGLPPLEAALCGNIVVGYSGLGGNEYFEMPIFRKVLSGDIQGMIESLNEAVKDVENGFLDSNAMIEARLMLRSKYKYEMFADRLFLFANKVEAT